VLSGLDNAAWQLLDSVRRLTGRGDGIGDRAERLIEEVRRTAADNEFHRPLAPVLRDIHSRAVALLDDAVADQATLATTAGSAALPARVSGSGAGAVSAPATTVGAQSAPSTTSAPGQAQQRRATHRIQASAAESVLEAELQAVEAEIRRYVRTDPDAEIVIDWHVVTDEGTE
jgi:hypothetical protein